MTKERIERRFIIRPTNETVTAIEMMETLSDWLDEFRECSADWLELETTFEVGGLTIDCIKLTWLEEETEVIMNDSCL